jgi:hypothetical protein
MLLDSGVGERAQSGFIERCKPLQALAKRRLNRAPHDASNRFLKGNQPLYNFEYKM